VNDKVYDGKVIFEAEGDKVLGYAELSFIPKEYPHLSKEAFPEEDPRRFVLEPLDGAFDELKEEFAVDVKDIIGGREYVVEAVVKDREGNVSVERIETPYIREFENFGKVLYEKGVIIGATYHVYYPDPLPWSELGPFAVHPLLGEYTSPDGIVISKHLDWATGYGINTFFIYYPPTWQRDSERILENIKTLFSHPMSKQIYIAITYPVEDRLLEAGVRPDEYGYFTISDLTQWRKILDDMRMLNTEFFNNKNYLRLNGKPVVFMGNSGSLKGNVTGFISDVKNTVNIYAIGQHAHPWAASSSYTIDGSGGWI
jgi:hypothetical protein